MRKISVQKYAQTLYELTKELSKEQVAIQVASFIKFLSKNKNIKLTEKVIKAFIEYANQQESVVDAELITAQKISPTQKVNLINQIKKEQQAEVVNLTEKIDQSILGGFVLKIKDTIYDASVKTSLEQLAGQMRKS